MITSLLTTITTTIMKMPKINTYFPLLALFFSSIPTASAIVIPGGFGNDLEMKQTVSIIVPNDWVVRATTKVLDKKVTWTGDVDWKDVLKNISNDNGFNLKINSGTKTITMRHKQEVTPPIKPPVAISIPKAIVSDDPIITNVVVDQANLVTSPVISSKPKPLKHKNKLPTDDASLIANVGNTISSLFEDKPALEVASDITTQNTNEILKPPVEDTEAPGVHSVVNTLADSVLKLFEPSPRKMSEDEIKFNDLLISLNILAKDLFVEKTDNQRDNIVKFYFSFTSNTIKVSSFVLFNKDTVYSPYLSNNIVLKDWYYTNYTHPVEINTGAIRPIKTNQVLFNRAIVAPKPKIIEKIEKPQFLKPQEYLAYRGEMLSTVFGRWAQDVSASLVWKFNSDFKITKEIRMYSSFLEATDQMVSFYNSTSNPLQTRFFLKNKTLLVEDLSIIYREK